MRSSVVAALLLAACSGGGGGGTPEVTFTFASAGQTLAEDAGPLDIAVTLHTSLPATSAQASVTVFDRANGTATAGSDYAALTPQVLTFPAGSIDGTTLFATLTPLDDLLVEGADESVRLGLMGASGGAVQGLSTTTVTLQDVHSAVIGFASALSSTTDESSGPRAVLLSLDLPPGVALGVAVGARVSDALNGTATSGADYSAFAARNVTFTAGSADGATQSVNLQVLDDAVIESDETVRLALSAPTSAAALGAVAEHVLTIQDDDAPLNSAFAASEGASGVENPLAYDELLNLGSLAVGTGPSAGTVVRVTNLGGSPMALGAPRLTGTHLNDFAVTLETSAPEALTSGLLPPDAPSPLRRSELSNGPGVALTLDPADLAGIAPLASVTLHGFPVPGLGDVTLQLRRMPLPFSDDALLRVDGVELAGGPAQLVGDLSLWSGSVLEEPGSRVFLALTSAGSRGFLQLLHETDRLVHVVPEEGAPGACRVVRGNELAALGFEAPPLLCGEPLEVPGAELAASTPPLAQLGSEALTVADCRLAIETDYQLFQKFGSTPGLTNYVTQLIAAISAQYFEDVQTTFSIAYLGVYTSAADPWTSQDSGGNSSALLNEFIGAWAPSSWPVSANLAHFISGANLGGGVAYVNVLCSQSFGFGVSGNINGNINWNSWSGAPANFTWDFVVVAHELGHNFGSNHTHAYCPPLDQCASNCNNVTACSQGTIMSYCHTCGGMDNIDLEFHPVTANIMRGNVNASCLGTSELAGGDYVQYRVRFNPLTSTGQRDANLELPHDANNVTQPFRVRLRGTAN